MAEEFSSTEISFLYFLATYPYICICVCIMFSPTSFFLLTRELKKKGLSIAFHFCIF